MKKTLFTMIALLAAMAGKAQNTALELTLSGVDDNTPVSISLTATGQTETPLATANVVGGKATLQWQAEAARLYAILIGNGQQRTYVCLDAGDKAQLKAEVGMMERMGQPVPAVKSPVVTGSATHALYAQRNVDAAAINARNEALYAKHKDFLSRVQQMQSNNDRTGIIAAYESAEGKQLQSEAQALNASIDSAYQASFNSNKDNWMGPMLILHNMPGVDESAAELYDQLSEDVKESFYGKILKTKVKPESLVGKKAPDFKFIDHATGTETSLYEQMKGARYVLFDVWASWCGPCRREIPNFKAQYELYKDKGFRIVSISADQKEADWLKALDEEKLPWPNGLDRDGSICNAFGVKFYPSVYLMDATTGNVIAIHNDARGANLRALLEKLMK